MKIKIGTLEVKLGEKPETSEIGGTGTSILGGIITGEEYNSDLTRAKGLEVYDKMRRSDGQVKATLLACELPIRAASYTVSPVSADQKDIEIADFIQTNLMDGMTITWDNFLKHALLMLPFGFSPFEKVYELKEKQIRWRKFAPRLPRTIYKWNTDAEGSLTSVTQQIFTNGKFSTPEIPVEKMLIFTNEKEGDNFEGVSMLRAAYKHWYYKDSFYKLDAISAERHSMGIPTYKHPTGISAAEIDRIESILQHLQAHEKQYVRYPTDHEFELAGLSGSIRDLLPSIDHHNRMISISILAHFLALGASDAGSYALSRDQSSFFLMALISIANNICDTINRYAIPQLVDYNFANVKKYPKLTASGLESRNMKEYAETVVSLINAGALKKDLTLMNQLRDMLHMAPMTEEEFEPENPETPVPDETIPPEDKTPETPGKSPEMNPQEPTEQTIKTTEKKHKRALTLAEGFVSFADIEKALQEAEAKFVTATKDIMARQISNLADAAAGIVDKRQLDRLDTLEVRYKSEMAEAMENILKELFDYGRDQVKKELSAQKNTVHTDHAEPLDPEQVQLIQSMLRARAKASAQAISLKLKNYTMFEVLRQVKLGAANRGTVVSVIAQGLRDLSDKELVASAAYSVNEAFNFGRGVQADKDKDGIDRVQYSAIMDNATCSVCEPLDGQEWDYADERTAKYASGNPDCKGRTLCRCVLVYIWKSEKPAVK